MISVCQHAERSLAAILIHSVAQPILEQLIDHAMADKPRDEAELMIVMEAVGLAELLVSLADEQNSTLNSVYTSVSRQHHVLCVQTNRLAVS